MRKVVTYWLHYFNYAKFKSFPLSCSLIFNSILFNAHIYLNYFSKDGILLPKPKVIWEDDQMESVVHLDDVTFEGFLEENKDVFVMFYAPCMYLWISHSLQMLQS